VIFRKNSDKNLTKLKRDSRLNSRF